MISSNDSITKLSKYIYFDYSEQANLLLQTRRNRLRKFLDILHLAFGNKTHFQLIYCVNLNTQLILLSVNSNFKRLRVDSAFMDFKDFVVSYTAHQISNNGLSFSLVPFAFKVRLGIRKVLYSH